MCVNNDVQFPDSQLLCDKHSAFVNCIRKYSLLYIKITPPRDNKCISICAFTF